MEVRGWKGPVDLQHLCLTLGHASCASVLPEILTESSHDCYDNCEDPLFLQGVALPEKQGVVVLPALDVWGRYLPGEFSLTS